VRWATTACSPTLQADVKVREHLSVHQVITRLVFGDLSTALARFSNALLTASLVPPLLAGSIWLRPVSPDAVRLKHVFPALLPFALGPDSQSSSKRTRDRERASSRCRIWVNALFALFGWWEAGCPVSQPDIERAVARAQHTTVHRRFAYNAYQECISFCRRTALDMKVGRNFESLAALINDLNINPYSTTPTIQLKDFVSGAKPVVAARMGLPEQAAACSVVDALDEPYKSMFKDMPNTIPLHVPRLHVKPCHKVSGPEWLEVCKRLLRTGTATLIPAEDVALGPTGQPLVGGLFTVDHSKELDRLINDRRPLNAAERRLEWASLPLGAQLCQLVLEDGDLCRASGDDISKYFYQLEHLESWLPRNAAGPPLAGKHFVEFGFAADITYHLAFRTVCMGDINAVDIAQTVHICLLRRQGAAQPLDIVTHPHTVPAGDVWEFVYIDDHWVIQKYKRGQSRKSLRDDAIVSAAHAAYESAGLPRAPDKHVRHADIFTILGTEVNTHTGRCGVAEEKLLSVANAAASVLLHQRLSLKAAEKLVGAFTYPFQHRKELNAVFHNIYSWMNELKAPTGDESLAEPFSWQKLPKAVREDLLAALLVVPFAASNVRWRVSNKLSATDATPTMCGGSFTQIPTKLTRALYRFAEHRGEHARLDWSGLEVALLPTKMLEPQEWVHSIVDALSWTTSRSWPFPRIKHVNIQETIAAKAELIDRAVAEPTAERYVNLNDSRVTVGAMAKGRSSSRHLNVHLRKCISYCIGGRKKGVNLWVGTHHNSADHPTRGREQPAPQPMPEWAAPYFVVDPSTVDSFSQRIRLPLQLKNLIDPPMQHLIHCTTKGPTSFSHAQYAAIHAHASTYLAHQLHQAHFASQPQLSRVRRFREIFAGEANLTAAFRASSNWSVDAPLEAFPEGVYRPDHDIRKTSVIRSLLYEALVSRNSHWHLGVPCGSFCRLCVNLNAGTRTNSNPKGNGALAREIEGNACLSCSLRIIHALSHDPSNTWSLENPRSSFLWAMPGIKRLAHNKYTYIVDYDQCFFGLAFDDKPKERIKKPSRILTNNPGLVNLACKCTRDHTHSQVLGGVKTNRGWRSRSALAGVYPPAFCRAFCQHCW